MTDKQARFIEAYCGEARLCAAEAARLAGYSVKTARQAGERLKRDPDVRAAIDRELEARTLSRPEVLERISRQAMGSMRDFLRLDDLHLPRLDLDQADQRGLLDLVESLEPTKFGYRVKLYSAQAALFCLLKQFSEEKAPGTPQNPIQVDHKVKMEGGFTLAMINDILERAIEDAEKAAGEIGSGCAGG